jgi:hypothetical protein
VWWNTSWKRNASLLRIIQNPHDVMGSFDQAIFTDALLELVCVHGCQIEVPAAWTAVDAALGGFRCGAV